jgi:hypothetical protein
VLPPWCLCLQCNLVWAFYLCCFLCLRLINKCKHTSKQMLIL